MANLNETSMQASAPSSNSDELSSEHIGMPACANGQANSDSRPRARRRARGSGA